MRPRDTTIDEAVLQATVALLEIDGYVNLSIAKIAAEAGTTKPALYRRWRTKAHLVHEAVFPALDADAFVAAKDLRAGIRAMVAGGVELLGRPAARAALPGLLAETAADAALAAEVLGRASSAAFGWLEDHVREGVSATTVFELVAGAAFMAATTRSRGDVDDRWIDEVTDFIVRGIAP